MLKKEKNSHKKKNENKNLQPEGNQIYNRREKNSKPYTKHSDNNPIISSDRPDSIPCGEKLINPHSINAGRESHLGAITYTCIHISWISFAYNRR